VGPVDEWNRDLKGSGTVILTRQEAEDFLYQEARLLDQRRFEEWLDLFTNDGIYWIPIADDTDPEQEPSILYDDSPLRAQRVFQLLHQPHYAQMPPSRTVHVISNVEVDNGQRESEALVRCGMVVVELRPGHSQQFGLGRQSSFAGHCEYRLRHEKAWRIALKKVLLIDRDLPVPNLSFIL
jgi:3-phenylpropionate/cinnamic acid dioxygenase small subunit